MTILIYAGHPAQYYFFKNIITGLKKRNHNVLLLIKTKDVLEKIVSENNEEYYNILPEGRKNSKLEILTGLLKRDFRLLKFTSNKKIDLFIGTDPSLAHIGWLKRIPVITVLEDDIDVIPTLAKLTFPFTNHIVTPKNVDVGKYAHKQIMYDGYMKLSYLHPDYFKPEPPHLPNPYSIIRLSALKAYHDTGIKGVDDNVLDRLLNILSKKGNVYISSETNLQKKYSKYLIKTNPSKFHHILAHAKILVSDSQSMSMEAAMLGVPSVRFSDFSGRISVLEELEHKYALTHGYKTNESGKFFEKVSDLVDTDNLEKIYFERRRVMLSEKIDVVSFMINLIEDYSFY